VKEPAKTIPRAILVSLIITAAVYLAVTIVGIGVIGVDQFAASNSPIASAAESLNIAGLVAIVIFAAAVATLSVLLSDLLSSSRTVFAMARNGDLPDLLSQMRSHNPVNSVIITSAIVLFMVLMGSIVQIAALTSLTILIYYAVTNLSSLKLPPGKRLYPRVISVAGLVSCLGLTLFLPLEEWLWTILLLIPGAVYSLFLKKQS
jgi:APA family basic amino acid/polyamine antiporter